jgi:hypothetical protein
VNDPFLDPIRQAACVEPVLQAALRVVIELRHGRSLGGRGAPDYGYVRPLPPTWLAGTSSGSSKTSTPGTTGALRRASAILRSVSLVTWRPRRAPEMVEGLQPDALARSVALHPRRASSRSIRAGLIRAPKGFESLYRAGLHGPGRRRLAAVICRLWLTVRYIRAKSDCRWGH